MMGSKNSYFSYKQGLSFSYTSETKAHQVVTDPGLTTVFFHQRLTIPELFKSQ